MPAEEWILQDPKQPHPNNPDVLMVQTKVHIRHNQSGEVRQILFHEPLEPGQPNPSDFIWEEGNYSCDCNRALFFARAHDIQPNEERPCGHERYSVNVQNPNTGKYYYQEFQ